ncbi:MAG: hypothetical protein M0Q38_10250 [Bacteroidales bacterium]|nr:hypothetical protein [Bacteroidales bacterium]
MKNLSEEILASFKQRIKENEELVNEVQKTLDGFRKDHQEMAAVLNANAVILRKGLAKGEKDRLNTYKDLMTGIHRTISSIQKEVVALQTSTVGMIHEFTTDRAQMAEELNKFFGQGRADRMQNEKIRMKEFGALMKNINDDIKCINDEVSTIFKNTNDMLERFEKEHQEMSDELRAELSKNLTERVEYTKTLLSGFQKRLSEISKENQKMAQKLRKDLANGETVRLNDYNDIMKGIQVAIKDISTEVKNIKKATNGILGDFLQNRVQASTEWNKMQKVMSQIRKTGVVSPPKEVIKKAEKIEVIEEIPVKTAKETPSKAQKEITIKEESAFTSFPEEPMTLEMKILDYINKHPKGVKISEMEEPLGQTRMRLGFTVKALLDEGKVLKVENIYYPMPKVKK